MKSITISMNSEGMEISHVGLNDSEYVGLLTTALWEIELRSKLAFGKLIEQEKRDANTSTSTETNSTADDNS